MKKIYIYIFKFIALSINNLILASGKALELPLRELQSNGSHFQTIKPHEDQLAHYSDSIEG